jgi:hypothetical protein
LEELQDKSKVWVALPHWESVMLCSLCRVQLVLTPRLAGLEPQTGFDARVFLSEHWSLMTALYACPHCTNWKSDEGQSFCLPKGIESIDVHPCR